MPPKITKTVTYLVGVLLITTLGLALLFSRDKNDIRYKGVPLSRHLLNRFLPPNADHAQRIADSHDALAFAGTNALPLLSEWLERSTPAWRVKLGVKLWNRGIASTLFPLKSKQFAACYALTDLKGDALPLAPKLAELCSGTDDLSNLAAVTLLRLIMNWRDEMPVAQEDMLRKAIERTIKELTARPEAATNSTIANRLPLMNKLRIMIGPGEPSQLIVTNLKSIPRDRRSPALRRLSRRASSYEAVEPYLLEDLRSTNAAIAENAAICLRNYGAVASNSLPRLREALSNTNLAVRKEASNAITRITVLMKEQEF
jgi:hypothetical protein